MLYYQWHGRNSEPWFVLLNSGTVTRAQLAIKTQGVKIPYTPSHFMKWKPKFSKVKSDLGCLSLNYLLSICVYAKIYNL